MTRRLIATGFASLALAASITAPAQAAPPSLQDILDDLIVCVMAPCP